MNLAGYRDALRKAVRDDYGTYFDDATLNSLIQDSLREYGYASDRFVETVTVTGDGTGVFSFPEGFIRVIRYEDSNGFEKPVLSWRDMHCDVRVRTGGPVEGVIADFDAPGKYRLWPNQCNTESHGKLTYSRVPDVNDLDDVPSEAIIDFCLFRMMLLDGKGSYQKHYKKWLGEVNAAHAGADTIRNRRKNRGGCFY